MALYPKLMLDMLSSPKIMLMVFAMVDVISLRGRLFATSVVFIHNFEGLPNFVFLMMFAMSLSKLNVRPLVWSLSQASSVVSIIKTKSCVMFGFVRNKIST